MSKRKDFHTTRSKTAEAHLPGDELKGPQPTNELHETDKSFQNFKRIIESTHDSVISLDMEGRVTYWSPSSEAIYGYKSEEVIGKLLKSFLVPEDKQKELSELIKKITGRSDHVTDLVTRRKTKDGRSIDVLLNIFALTDDDRKIIGICGIAKDITQQLAREEEVRKQHNILQQSEDLAKTGSWEYIIKSKEFLWSDGMFDLFEIPKGTTVCPPIYVENSIEADKPVSMKIVQCIQSKFEPFEEIIHIKGRGGAVKTVAVKAAPLKNEN